MAEPRQKFSLFGSPNVSEVRRTQVFEQLGVIGCGLMGGSLALAMKRAGLVRRVVGYSKSPSTTQRALQMGVIDVEAPSALLAVSGADVVVLAVPVGAMGATFKSIRHLVSEKTLLIDVGSTKQDVVLAAKAALGRNASAFVPCHPIAGSEMSGVESARADLYAGKQVILTPTEETSVQHVERARSLWQALGCQVSLMSPKAHDDAYAAVSHLPHLLAFAYMEGILGQEAWQQLQGLAGSGFADFTRIAASEPKLWRDVLLANKAAVLEQSRHFQRALHQLEVYLNTDNGEQLQKTIARVSAARSCWKPQAK